MLFAVCGLHLDGGPLNHQLVSRGASLVTLTKTSPKYSMLAIFSDASPTKPALVFHPVGGPATAAISVEVWEVPDETIGTFLQGVPPPLAFGTVHLEDGSTVYGFVSEGWVTDPAATRAMGLTKVEDITSYGGWREWQRSLSGSA